MERLRTIAVFLLWGILAYRVWDLAHTPGYSRDFLIMFAFLAWAGGYLTNEIIRIVYRYFQDWRERRG